MDENEKKDKKKSELDQEQIEASKKELAKLKTAIATYSKAAAKLVAATAMKPVHTTIEQISEKYEAAKDEVSRRYGLLVDVETRRGQQNAKIGTKAANQREDSKKVRDEQKGRSRSAILSTEERKQLQEFLNTAYFMYEESDASKVDEKEGKKKWIDKNGFKV